MASPASKITSFANNGVLLLLIATFFWGGNAVAGRLANGEVSPMLLTFFRWVIAGSVLIFFAWPHLKRDWPIIRKRLPYFIMIAPLGFTIFNVLLYTALNYTTALNATIEQAAMPMFIFLINFLVFRTKPFAIQVMGYVITLIGVVIVVSGGSLERLMAIDFNRGDIIMMFAAFCYGAYSVALRAKPQIHWLSFLTTLVIIAAIISVPFMLYEATTDKFIWPHSALGWGVVLYAAIFPSFVSQATFIRGNELLGSNNAALFINMVPIFGVILSVVILGEAFQFFHGLAIVLVLGGIYLAQHFTPKA